ncbi:MAG: glycosyltransferase [Planctomycetota bacterium]|nr:glycosyltransferase [Planctomycetota bacterium]
MFFLKAGRRKLLPLEDRGPLNVMFLLSSMPVGGAETLLVNLLRRMSRQFRPQVVCLKEPGELGSEISSEFPVHSRIIRHKYDFGVIGRLKNLFLEQEVDAIVTVGAGDKMFWGRIAAERARVPVILSALHSTGWPDGVGKLNRALTGITDGFIAVAKSHGEFMVEFEKFPAAKVKVIPNGVDTSRFSVERHDRRTIREELGIAAEDPVVGFVAALRPEKNQLLVLKSAARLLEDLPAARFLIVGDGPERPMLEKAVADMSLKRQVLFAGLRSDIPELISAMDVFSLTSRNEASPVSIMEAMAMQKPVVAPDVGSIVDTVRDGETGFLFQGENAEQGAGYWLDLLTDPEMASRFGNRGREVIQAQASLQVMVEGYENLIREVYSAKVENRIWANPDAKSGKDVPGYAGKMPV